MKLFWKLYSVLFSSIILSSALQLLDKNSFIEVYYNTTIVFSNWFIIPYLFNILNVFLGCIACIYIFFYAFDIQGLSRAPQWFFYLRLLSDCTGHSYGLKMVQSGFTQGELTGFIGLATLILPILPSYIIQWRITFKQK